MLSKRIIYKKIVGIKNLEIVKEKVIDNLSIG